MSKCKALIESSLLHCHGDCLNFIRKDNTLKRAASWVSPRLFSGHYLFLVTEDPNVLPVRWPTTVANSVHRYLHDRQATWFPTSCCCHVELNRLKWFSWPDPGTTLTRLGFRRRTIKRKQRLSGYADSVFSYRWISLPLEKRIIFSNFFVALHENEFCFVLTWPSLIQYSPDRTLNDLNS